MRRVVVGLVVALSLGGSGAIAAFANAEYCVTEDAGGCTDDEALVESAAEAPAQDAFALTDIAATPAEQPDNDAATTRTIGPPRVVNPFAGTAVPAAAQAEPVTPFSRPADQQRLPPGPPSRFP